MALLTQCFSKKRSFAVDNYIIIRGFGAVEFSKNRRKGRISALTIHFLWAQAAGWGFGGGV
jgi:hypothetical protein